MRDVRDPQHLARHRHERCRATEAEIARALQGNWREEHLFALEQALQMYECYQRQLRACEKRISACLRGFADKSGGAKSPPKAGQQKPRRNEPKFGARALVLVHGSKVTAVQMRTKCGSKELSRAPLDER